MQELINTIKEKANLSEEDATKAAQAAVDFVKSKVPPFFADKIEDLINGKFDLGSMMGGFGGGKAGESPLDKLGSMFGK